MSKTNNDIYIDALALIMKHYGDRKAERSQVPLINHIIEGLHVLTLKGADDLIKAAFCLHPMYQSDQELFSNRRDIYDQNPYVMMLVMEYRRVANASLSDIVTWGWDYNIDETWQVPVLKRSIVLSPLYEVNWMLIADKVQNRKDFELYHKGTHERSVQLDFYFKEWLRALEVSEDMYNLFVDKIIH